MTIVFFLALAAVIIAYICYRMAFLVPRHVPMDADTYDIPEGDIYEPHRELMVSWMKAVRALPHRDVSIRSFDGLTLRGRYYEFSPGAPIELMFHGYRGDSERDLCGGVQRCFRLGRSALIVDQRGCGRSEGNVITFGVRESRDCRDWIDHTIAMFGPDVKIILTGISMGASTVLMTAGKPLPPNVVGVLADCGYSSAKEIIQVVIRIMKLPPKLAYPFVRLGARLFGHFDLEETPPIEAVKHASMPVLFIHGEADTFVPCQMSRTNYDACASQKQIMTVPGAGHGLSYIIDPEGYLNTLQKFFDPLL